MSDNNSRSQKKVKKKGLAGRKTWHRMAAILVTCWALIVLAGVIGQHWRPDLSWVALHSAALGVATNAVVVWSDYFATSLLRSPETNRKRQVFILVTLNIGILLLMGGMEAAKSPLIVAGAVIALLTIAGHIISLGIHARNIFATRLGKTTTRYYVVAGVWFLIAGVLGIFLSPAGGAHLSLFLTAHIAASVLGFLGLAVVGTLITFWPTVLRTRMAPGAEVDARRVLPLFCASIVTTGVGGVIGQGWLSALGLAGYLACFGFTVTAMVQVSRVKPPRSFAARSMICGLAWLIGTLFVALVICVVEPDRQAIMNKLPDLAWPLLGGFGAQLIIGAMAYLLPSIIGGGPAMARRRNAVMDTMGDARLVSANVAGLGLITPLPHIAALVMVGVILLNVVVFFVLVSLCGATKKPLDVTDPLMGVRTRRFEWVAGGGVIVLALAIATAIAPASMVGSASGNNSGAAAPHGPIQHVHVDAANMKFDPSAISVAAGTHLIIDVTNTDTGGQVHDLTLANGATSGRLMPGNSGSADAGDIKTSQQAWCSIAGHKQMGMVLQINVSGTTEASDSGDMSQMSDMAGSSGNDAKPDPSATMTANPFDAALQPASSETEHDVTLNITEQEMEVAPGVRQMRWTYNGSTPGPTLRGHIGDKFVVTLRNSGSMGHSIDFHAGSLAPDQPMRTIAPGESLTYTFTATKSGIWMYHCSTAPMSLHIANGMFGAVIIDPPGLTHVDKEYLMVQSDHWYGAQGEINDASRIGNGNPDAVVFNGYAFQYDTHPLAATVGQRVRFWVLDVGPDEELDFHVVGGQFDTVWSEGAFKLQCGYQPAPAVDSSCSSIGPGGSQTLALGAAEGGYVEMVPPEAGHYKIVNHIMSDAEKGAHGVLAVTG